MLPGSSPLPEPPSPAAGSSAHFPSLLLTLILPPLAEASTPHPDARSSSLCRRDVPTPPLAQLGDFTPPGDPVASLTPQTNPHQSTPAAFSWMQPQAWGAGTQATLYGAGFSVHTQGLPRPSRPPRRDPWHPRRLLRIAPARGARRPAGPQWGPCLASVALKRVLQQGPLGSVTPQEFSHVRGKICLSCWMTTGPCSG